MFRKNSLKWLGEILNGPILQHLSHQEYIHLKLNFFKLVENE